MRVSLALSIAFPGEYLARADAGLRWWGGIFFWHTDSGMNNWITSNCAEDRGTRGAGATGLSYKVPHKPNKNQAFPRVPS